MEPIVTEECINKSQNEYKQDKEQPKAIIMNLKRIQLQTKKCLSKKQKNSAIRQ